MTDKRRQMILCPHTEDLLIETAELVDVLHELGMLGDELEASSGRNYCVGPHFLQHISFMGCAPAIEFEPSGGEFTYLHLPEPFSKPRWQADLDMARPTCPSCRKRISGPAQYVDAQSSYLLCPHCQQQAPVCAYDWREFGGCARTMVSIVNVYPKEAIPSDNLLNRLAELTEDAWRFFYLNAPLP
jgi:hypothetical protein